ncbi:hypothetical protein Tco_0303684 [Tanacetum coccineum]
MFEGSSDSIARNLPVHIWESNISFRMLDVLHEMAMAAFCVTIHRKLESSSYHALGACLRPYNAFLRRLNFLDDMGSKRATGANDPLRNQFLPFEQIP